MKLGVERDRPHDFDARAGEKIFAKNPNPNDNFFTIFSTDPQTSALALALVHKRISKITAPLKIH